MIKELLAYINAWYVQWMQFRKEKFGLQREDKKEKEACKTCKVLEDQLFQANNEKTKLLEQILMLTAPKSEPTAPQQSNFEPVKSSVVPWRIRQHMLEEEDRAKAKILREQEERNKELEEELKTLNARSPIATNGNAE